MQAQRTRWGWTLRLDRGEEIVETVRVFAGREGIRAGILSGIGAVGETEAGFFDPAAGAYETRRFEGDHEIGALTGNISELDGQPFPHCHIVLGGRDMVAYTGHLLRGLVSVTCELQIVTDPGILVRMARPDLGYNPLDPR